MKAIVSYILIFTLIALYALFLDAPSGLFVLIIFISALVLSTALHVYALKTFAFDAAVSSELAEKGEEIELKINVGRAAFFLPTVFEIKFALSHHLIETEKGTDEPVCAVTLGRNAKSAVLRLSAQHWGTARISLRAVKATDFLGIFAGIPRLGKFHPLHRFFAENSFNVRIYPRIPDLEGNDELVRALEDASAYDDNEQSREVPFATVGFPGYEHRDYVPGDPLKSVNWKLSAKRDRLLVRKPEAYAGGDQILVLDPRGSDCPDSQAAVQHEQIAAEALLALVRTLTKQEILCRVYARFNREWRMFPVTGEDELEKLRFALTEYAYTDSADRLPDIADDNASGCVIFTACPDDELRACADSARKDGNAPEIASATAGAANNRLIRENNGEVSFSRC